MKILCRFLPRRNCECVVCRSGAQKRPPAAAKGGAIKYPRPPIAHFSEGGNDEDSSVSVSSLQDESIWATELVGENLMKKWSDSSIMRPVFGLARLIR